MEVFKNTEGKLKILSRIQNNSCLPAKAPIFQLKLYTTRNRLKTQENTLKRVENKLGSHLMENFSEGPIGGQKCQTAQISQHKQGFNLLSTKNSN